VLGIQLGFSLGSVFVKLNTSSPLSISTLEGWGDFSGLDSLGGSYFLPAIKDKKNLALEASNARLRDFFWIHQRGRETRSNFYLTN
jgi:hypothetical protein